MPKENCPMCQVIEDKNVGKLYEDDRVIALINRLPASQGHILLMPKEHYPIIEQVPDTLIAHIFTIANQLSTVLFETLGIQGTNILVNNGIEAGQDMPHFVVHVIGRVEGDGLNFTWQPKQISEEEMSSVELMIKEEAKSLGNFQTKEKPKPIDLDKDSKAEAIKHKKDEHGHEEENYLIKHLKRMP